ncbi:helix-turn-helix domain-containing protein [Salmonella enterica subsp. enterica]|nr:helix-turn-helix domain-containing protein [Salmonella enterica subsp. enterica serovar Paratyphi A]
MKRRHLSESQRAMVAARLANLEHGQKKADVEISISQTDAARMLNVSRETVSSAKQVQANATPELVAAVDSGKVAVSAAAVAATWWRRWRSTSPIMSVRRFTSLWRP